MRYQEDKLICLEIISVGGQQEETCTSIKNCTWEIPHLQGISGEPSGKALQSKATNNTSLVNQVYYSLHRIRPFTMYGESLSISAREY